MCKIKFTSFIFFFFSVYAFSQTEKDTLTMTAQDSSIIYSMELREIIVSPDGVTTFNDEERKAKLILKRRIFRVYPYAKLTADKLTQMNATMASLKTEKEKKKYFKIVEDYMENEFEAQLKKLSRKQGQILVKLIYRQTGFSAFDLIKDYKSGWKAFWSNTTAKLFDINLKTPYAPYDVNEDYFIETILVRAFDHGRLVRQEAATPIDYDKLSDAWQEKAKKINK